MPADLIGRTPELDAAARFVARLQSGAGTLMFEGAAGVGKTTLLRAAVDAAHRAGATVLRCGGSAAEARLAYAGLDDLLARVPDAIVAGLTGARRAALDAALLRSDSAADVDPRAIASATLAILEALAADATVVVAVDDLHWLDGPTVRVIEFCARRLPARAGLLAARRVGEGGPGRAELVGLGDPERVEVVGVCPLARPDLGRLLELHDVEAGAVPRIQDLAEGNPFYALELARAAPGTGRPVALPESLDDVVAARLWGLSADEEEVLLALAALADPRIATLERVLGAGATARLEEAERRGVIVADGDALRFDHPLLAEGVYSRASTAQRREVHRRLSETVATAEERARHLAYAGSPDAVRELEAAAPALRTRGAPDAAAELLDLALGLGAGPETAVRAAELHLDTGAPVRALELLQGATPLLEPGPMRAFALALLGELRYKGDSFVAGQELLEQALAEPGLEDPLRATIEMRLSFARFNVRATMANGLAITEAALERMERRNDEALLSQALSCAAINRYAHGQGVDEATLERALALHDPTLRAGAELSSPLIAGFIYTWSGRLTDARRVVSHARRNYAEQGEQLALAWSGFLHVWIDCWRGRVTDAIAPAQEAAVQLRATGTPNGAALAGIILMLIAAFTGDAAAAEADYAETATLLRATGWHFVYFPEMLLGFLELSVGDYPGAARRLEPLAAEQVAHGMPEPTAAGQLFAGDAAEALIGSGAPERAEPIVAWLEERGTALDRAWAIAVGARTRGLLHATAGDLGAAEASLRDALRAHERVEMPIEHARSLLVLGRILRRQRRRGDARQTLEQARATFVESSSPRWAEQAESELAGLGLGRTGGDELTPAELRVARLAATGLTNEQVAAQLVVSPKTVEAHLGRVYRKLAIRSRAELGARMG